MRHVCLALLLVCATGPAALAAEADIPDGAKRAIAGAQDAVLDQHERFRAAAIKEQERLVTALEREMVRETKAGRLDGAQAVRDALDKAKDPQWVDTVIDAADVDLLGRPRQANQVVLWNQHNGPNNDRGTTAARVVLLLDGRVVAKGDSVEVPWKAGTDSSVTVPLPNVRWNGLRIEIEAIENNGGGLAEVQVLVGGRNVAPQLQARASGCYPGPSFTAARINDNITTSANFGAGYWLLPDGVTGWIELTPPAPANPPAK